MSWPVTAPSSDPHYDRVEAMIKPQRYPLEHPPTDREDPRLAARRARRAKAELPAGGDLATRVAPGPGERIEEEPNLHGAPRYLSARRRVRHRLQRRGQEHPRLNYLSAAKRAGPTSTGAEVRPSSPRRRRLSDLLRDPSRAKSTPWREEARALGRDPRQHLPPAQEPGRLPDSARCSAAASAATATCSLRRQDQRGHRPARGPVITSAIRPPTSSTARGRPAAASHRGRRRAGVRPWLVNPPRRRLAAARRDGRVADPPPAAGRRS
jgi:hypothetical protein